MNNCQGKCEILLDLIDKRLDKMETKLDDLVSFKFKLIGASIVVAALSSFLIQILLNKL
jgi:tetrahydromethanopterin S-methyltransferase subunit G